MSWDKGRAQTTFAYILVLPMAVWWHGLAREAVGFLPSALASCSHSAAQLEWPVGLSSSRPGERGHRLSSGPSTLNPRGPSHRPPSFIFLTFLWDKDKKGQSYCPYVLKEDGSRDTLTWLWLHSGRARVPKSHVFCGEKGRRAEFSSGD